MTPGSSRTSGERATAPAVIARATVAHSGHPKHATERNELSTETDSRRSHDGAVTACYRCPIDPRIAERQSITQFLLD